MFLPKELQLLLMSTTICIFVAAPCPKVPKLDVLPGIGWDSLSNNDTRQLMKLSYDKCKLTSDGRYLIPDNIDAEAFQPENRQVVGELFGHWFNYTAPTTSGFKVENETLEKFSPLFYSFSNEYRDVKYLQVKHDTFTSRIQLRQRFYRVQIKSNSMLSNSVTSRFEEVITAVSGNRLEEAKRLAAAIVSDYGTHYAKTVDVGSIYIKEDYLRSYFLNLYTEKQERIISAAKMILRECTGFTWNEKEELDATLVEEYKASLLEKKTRFYGLPNWNNEVKSSYLVAIEQSGDLLTSLVTETNFPYVNSSSVLSKVRELLFEAIREYLTVNIHYGCTIPNAANFDYFANMDDGSCKPQVSKYVFGGVFQNCLQQGQAFTSGDCARYGQINNPISGSMACPAGFQPTPLFTHFLPYNSNSGSYSCRYGNSNSFTALSFKDYLKLTTYSCITNSTDMQNSYKFGGLYSADVVNIHTNKRSCPPEYTNVYILEGKLSVCVNSTNSNSTKAYELPFGGFTSYMQEFLCPEGYTRYLALKYGESNVYYCLHTRNLTHYGFEPKIKRPQIYIFNKNFEEHDNSITPYSTEL